MNQTQKIIKYCALAFAFFLIASILSGIVAGLSAVSGFFNDDEPKRDLEKTELTEEIKSLDFELNATNLTIKNGKEFSIETNNKYITTDVINGKLVVKEKDKHYIYNNNNDFILYVPKNFAFEEISLKAGAGNIDIDELNSEELYLNLGAGNVSIDELYVKEEASIKGGVGKLSVRDGSIKDLDINIGVGETVLKTELIGRSTIKAGVGAVKLTLIGFKKDYEIRARKGLGSINIDGKDVSDENTIGDGKNTVDIKGGVGSIDVKFKEMKATL